MPTFGMLIRCIIAIDTSITFPAAGNARSAAALEHALFACRCRCLAAHLIRIIATIISAITDERVIHTLSIVAGVLMAMTLLGAIYEEEKRKRLEQEYRDTKDHTKLRTMLLIRAILAVLEAIATLALLQTLFSAVATEFGNAAFDLGASHIAE